MIMVDNRIGSADLVGYLRHWLVPCEHTRLDFGDAAFAGNGPLGPQTTAIGVEIKRVRDALQCMGDGRFSGHQLPGLVRSYDRVWLVIEGQYHPDSSNGLLLEGTPGKHGRTRTRQLSVGPRGYMYRDLDNWCTTMEVRANLRVRRTGDRAETARFVADLHGWWNKDWADHRSHLALHDQRPDTMIFRKPTLVEMVAAQLPGIGWKKALTIARRFKNVESMVEASKDEWAEIDGIGDTMAERIWFALRRGV